MTGPADRKKKKKKKKKEKKKKKKKTSTWCESNKKKKKIASNALLQVRGFAEPFRAAGWPFSRYHTTTHNSLQANIKRLLIRPRQSG